MWILRRRRWLSVANREGLTIACAAIGLVALGVGLEGLEGFRDSQLQHRRIAEQAQLVDAMEAVPNAVVSELVTDWLLTYPQPSEERLAELRDLARQVQTDPAPLLGAATEVARSGGPEPDRSRARVVWSGRPVFVRTHVSSH